MGPREQTRVPAGTRTLLRLIAAAALGAGVLLSAPQGAQAAVRVVVDHPAALPRNARAAPLARTASFAVMLAPANPGLLTALLDEVNDPSSPLFRHYLSEPQYVADFAPSPPTVQDVARYFTHQGLTVSYDKSAPLQLNVSGPSSDVARAFATPLRSVSVSGRVGTEFSGAATLPSGVAGAVSSIYGLSTVLLPETSQRVAPTAAARPRDEPATTTPGNCAGADETAAGSGSFLPDQQAEAYGLQTAWANGDNGAGEVVGVYELANYVASDVTTYFSCYKLKPSISVVNVDGGPERADDAGGTSGPEGEADLDIEEAGVLAPGAQIVVYQGTQSPSTGVLDVFKAIATADRATVVTTSWGGCEIAEESRSDISAEAVYFNQMALQGQSVVAASGDSGSSDCWNDSVNNPGASAGLAVDDPASQPTVTGVGALTVTALAQSTPPRSPQESVWNNYDGASGGGVSQVWATKPAWQTGDDVPATNARLVPDLSVMGDPATAFVEYSGGQWNQIGGTSVGAPLVAALVATAAEVCGVRLGSLNPTLYAMAAAGTGFDDVTAGSNSLYLNQGSSLYHNHHFSAEAADYPAGPGYDMASGLGSPDPTTFIGDLCTVAASPSTSSLAVTPASHPGDVTTGATATVTVRDSANEAIPNATPVLSATEPGAHPTVTALTPLTNANGVATFAVDTAAPGTVTVTASLGAVVLATGTVTFSSTLAVTTEPFRSLGAAGTVAVASDGTGGRQLAAGVTTAHLLDQEVTGGTAVDDSRVFHLPPVTGAPAVSCLQGCAVAVDVGGDLGVITNAQGHAPRYTNLGLRAAPARHVVAGSLSLVVGDGYSVVAYRTTTGQLMLARWGASASAATYTDLTTKYHLATASGTPSLVAPTATRADLAVRIGTKLWLLRVGATNSAENVSSVTGYAGTGPRAITGSPTLARDGASGRLEAAVLTVGGSLLVFQAAAATPNTLGSVAAVVAAGVTAARWAPGATPTSPDTVLAVVNHVVRLVVDNPDWTSLNVATLSGVPISPTGLTSGATADVTAASALYAVRP